MFEPARLIKRARSGGEHEPTGRGAVVIRTTRVQGHLRHTLSVAGISLRPPSRAHPLMVGSVNGAGSTTPQASADASTSTPERAGADTERRGDVGRMDSLQQHREYRSVAVVDPVQERQHVGRSKGGGAETLGAAKAYVPSTGLTTRLA
jgi:hypothetical protein